MDWIIEHEQFFFGMAVGAWVVLVVFGFVTSRLQRDVKKLERYVRTSIERTDRENDAS